MMKTLLLVPLFEMLSSKFVEFAPFEQEHSIDEVSLYRVFIRGEKVVLLTKMHGSYIENREEIWTNLNSKRP